MLIIECVHCGGSGVCKGGPRPKPASDGWTPLILERSCRSCVEASGHTWDEAKRDKIKVLCSVCKGVEHVWLGPKEEQEK